MTIYSKEHLVRFLQELVADPATPQRQEKLARELADILLTELKIPIKKAARV
jgi:hypothetical protein